MLSKIGKNILKFLIIIITLLLIIGAGVYNKYIQKKEESTGVSDVKELPVLDNDFMNSNTLNKIGDSDSKVLMLILSDYGCPWSKKYYDDTIKPFLNDNKHNNISIQYDFLVLKDKNNLETPSLIAAEAAYCANEQGKFWEMHDRLFGLKDAYNSNETAFTKNNVAALSSELGLDVSDFNHCLNESTYQSEIYMRSSHYLNTYAKLGVPATFLNGKPITILIENEKQMLGAMSSVDLQNAIQTELNK